MHCRLSAVNAEQSELNTHSETTGHVAEASHINTFTIVASKTAGDVESCVWWRHLSRVTAP